MSTKDVKELAIEQAKKFGGKLEVCPKVPIETKADLGIAYTPGVAAVSSAIYEKKRTRLRINDKEKHRRRYQ